MFLDGRPGMKVCGCCLATLKLDSFAKNACKKDGLSATCKQCMKSVWRKWRDKGQNRTKANAARRAGRRKDPRNFLFNEARSRAKIMGKPFSITIEDVAIPVLCPVFGQPLTVKGEVGNWFSASLDEVVHGLGYVRGNVKVISRLANAMKHKASPAQLVQFAQWILENFDGTERRLDTGQGAPTDQDQHARQTLDGTCTWERRNDGNAGNSSANAVAQIPARSEQH